MSFMEILPKARGLERGSRVRQGAWLAVASFFAGIGVIALIDWLVPSIENPHEIHRWKRFPPKIRSGSKTTHGDVFDPGYRDPQFPEGIATFAAALHDPSLGVTIAVAVAIHNIPEGIAVSVLSSTPRAAGRKAFSYSFLSGLAEPLGAVLGYLLFFRFFNGLSFGLLFGSVAGIMVLHLA